MSSVRSIVNTRSATLVSALLLSTAFSVPAYAIETVVVTAEKKAEDIQTVPIAVTAFSTKDLASHQIDSFKDIQFNMPSVTYSNGFLGGGNFSVRGIGSSAVSLSGDSGIAFNENDIYYAAPPLATGTYFDLDRIEVLRGPQSTLYGRNATGGAFNAITTKPDLDEYMVGGEATYGNYNDKEIRAVANIPIIAGKLGLRVAGFGELRDGDVGNLYKGTIFNFTGHGNVKRMDSRDDYAGRASLRWQPSDETTIDVVLEHSAEADSRIRSSIQGCVRDPSGVFGCLPTGIGLQPENLNAAISNTFVSDISPLGGTPFQLTQLGGPATALNSPGPNAADIISQDLHKTTSDYQPYTQLNGDAVQFIWHQQLNDVLTFDLHGDYNRYRAVSSQGTNGTISSSFADGSAVNAETLAQGFTLGALGAGALPLNYLAGGLVCPCYPAYTPPVAPTNRLQAFQAIFAGTFPINAANYTGAHFGLAPVSGPYNFGISGGNPPLYWADHISGFDHQDSGGSQYSVEARIASSFSGPLNFLAAVYHLETRSFYNYEISSSSTDLIANIIGSVSGGDGLTFGPGSYNNINTANLSSTAGFAEIYYQIMPDELKFTMGARLTSDNKAALSQNLLANCFFAPSVFAGHAAALAQFLTTPACGLQVPGLTNASVRQVQTANFSALTGRGVLDWTPKLDFTDQTLVYASYSRGYRSGGFNPAAAAGAVVSYSQIFKPETVDAIEIGTKNTLFDGTVQANLDFWYYDYKNYQISEIINKTAINANIASQLWGGEGEFFWQPNENWSFNADFGLTDSAIGQVSLLDPRNPSHNDPNTTVLKDFFGANCTITNKAGTGAPYPIAGPGFVTDPILATLLKQAPVTSIPGVAAGVAFINGSITGAYFDSCGTLQAALDGIYTPALDPYTVAGGIPVSIANNKMPNTPPLTFGVGAQYTAHLGGGYALVPRVDYYWKGRDYYSMFNGPEDVIKSWDELNAQLQLNSPNDVWYLRAWVKNALDRQNITGGGAGADAQGLFNNLSVEPPRTYGISLGAHW